MIIKKCITTFCIIASAFASGAASNAPHSVITYKIGEDCHEITSDNIVGLSCGTRGNCGLFVSTGATAKPRCSITLAYSEHHEPTELEQIVHALHDTKKDDHFCEEFRIFCAIEAAKQSDPTIIGPQTTSIAAFATIPKAYSLIALRITLGTHKMSYAGFYQNPEGKGAGTLAAYPIWRERYNGLLPKSARSITHTPTLSDEFGTNPQSKADDLQKEHADEPFHLVLDLAAWRDYLAPYQLALQQEHEKNSCRSCQ